jgi:hypothetical protein
VLTLRGEYRLRVFENRVLRRIFGSKREEGAGGWRRLHKEGICKLYTSPNIIQVITSRRMKWEGHIALMGEMRYVYSILVGEPEGKRSFERPRHRWKKY